MDRDTAIEIVLTLARLHSRLVHCHSQDPDILVPERARQLKVFEIVTNILERRKDAKG